MNHRIVELCDRTRFVLLAALTALIPALIDPQIYMGSGPETKFRLFTYGLLLALLLWIPPFLLQPVRLRLNAVSVSLLLWCAYNLGRGWLDPQPDFAFELGLEMSAWALFALLTAQVCRTSGDFLRLVGVAALCQLFPVVYAIGNTFDVDIYFQWYLGKPWRWGNELIGEDRSVIFASLGNPNYYAHYGALLLAWLAALAVTAKRWWSRSFFALYTLALLYTLVFTRTRGIWLGIAFAGGTLLLLGFLPLLRRRGPDRRLLYSYLKWVTLAGVTLALIVAALFGFESYRGGGPLHAIAQRFDHAVKLRDASMRARPLMWMASLRLWHEAPLFGQGHGRYASENLEAIHEIAQQTGTSVIQRITTQMNTIRSDYSHNDYLQILAETGAVGFALFLLVLLCAISRGIYFLLFMESSGRQRILLFAATAVCLVVAVHCGFDFPLHLPASAILFGLGLAGILALTRRDEEVVRTPPFWLRSILSLLLIVLIGLGGTLVLRHFLASHQRFQGTEQLRLATETSRESALQSHQHLGQAERHLQRARRFFPGSGEILYHLGRAYLGQSDLPRAIHVLEQACDLYGTPEAYRLLAHAYFEHYNYSRARDVSRILEVLDPTRYEIHFLLGKLEFVAGNFQQAESHFRAELKHDPENPDIFYYLGRIYEKYEQPAAAARMYEDALALNPAVLNTQERLAELCAGPLHRLVDAKEHFQLAWKIAQQLRDPRSLARLEVRLRDVQQKLNLELEKEQP